LDNAFVPYSSSYIYKCFKPISFHHSSLSSQPTKLTKLNHIRRTNSPDTLRGQRKHLRSSPPPPSSSSLFTVSLQYIYNEEDGFVPNQRCFAHRLRDRRGHSDGGSCRGGEGSAGGFCRRKRPPRHHHQLAGKVSVGAEPQRSGPLNDLLRVHFEGHATHPVATHDKHSIY